MPPGFQNSGCVHVYMTISICYYTITFSSVYRNNLVAMHACMHFTSRHLKSDIYMIYIRNGCKCFLNFIFLLYSFSLSTSTF